MTDTCQMIGIEVFPQVPQIIFTEQPVERCSLIIADTEAFGGYIKEKVRQQGQ